MTPAADEKFLILSDGRKLGYQVLGDPDGQPLFFFHGTPGSRLVLRETDDLVSIPGTRWILPERPGYGISDPKTDRSIPGWADDVKELADAMGLKTFSVAGGSGGAPYALACGAKMPDRVNKVLLFNPAAPVNFKGAKKGMSFGNRVGYGMARLAPWAMNWILKYNVTAFKKSPIAVLQSMASQLPEPDRVLLQDSEYINAVLRDISEGYRNGHVGHYQDIMLSHAKQGWGFNWEDVSMPVYVWHGEQDNLSPIQTVKRMVQLIPNCKTRYLSDAGHLLIDYPHVVEDVAKVLLSSE